MTPRDYTTAEAAAVLGIARTTVLKHIGQGHIEGRKWGRDWRIKRREVERFAATRKGPGRPRKVAREEA